MPKRGHEMEQIRSALAVSDNPLNSLQIAHTVYGSKKPADVAGVDQALLELTACGDVFEHPPAKKGERKRFWNHPPQAWTRERILQRLAPGKKTTLKSVRDAIPASYRPFFDEALGLLIAEGRVYSFFSGRYKYLLNRRPRAAEILSGGHLTALKAIISKLNPHRKDKLTVDNVLAFLDGHETFLKPHPSSLKEIPESVIYDWYKDDLAKLMGSKSVPIPWTWSRYENWCEGQGSTPDLADFHNRFKELARSGKIELVPHGMSEPVSAAELKIAIRTERGELLYYWKWLQEKT